MIMIMKGVSWCGGCAKDCAEGGADSAIKDLKTRNVDKSYSKTMCMNDAVILFHQSKSFLQLLELVDNDTQLPKSQEYVQNMKKAMPRIKSCVLMPHDIKEQLQLLKMIYMNESCV